jgi:hypothetical protein
LSPHSPSTSNRRKFLKQVGIVGTASLMPGALARLHGEPTGERRDRAHQSPSVGHDLLGKSAFYLIPLGSIRPTGWLKTQLQIQADGLSGHLGETWADVGPNSGWLGGTGESWERGPYFLDGLVPLAYLLDDARLKEKAQKFVDWTLNNQLASGMLGPHTNDDWWPRFVMLKALTQYQEATGDARVIPAMQRYFTYQFRELRSRRLQDWGKFRWQDEVLSIVWLYRRTGEPQLLDLARLLQSQGYDWVGQFSNFPYKHRITPEEIGLDADSPHLKDIALATHGVNNGQAIKTGPVWSLISRSESDRRAVLQMIAELDKYHGLPNGMFSCDEHLAGLNPSQGSELYTVVEYMFSLEQSLAILGDPTLGDRLEKLAFNALPGTLTDDMWAHQYNQESNQVECSLHHKPWTTDGPESNLFGLDPNFGCCTANFHQGWPKFAASLFMLSENDGLVATAYAPCSVSTVVRGVPVSVIEETDYPFHGTIQLTVDPSSAVAFPLLLRVPAWEADATIRVNGQMQPVPQAGSFVSIDRTWRAGDRVELKLSMKPRISRSFQDSVVVERGPLVFSYGIGEDWLKLRDRGLTADWQVYPTTQWNYALQLDPDSPTRSITVVETGMRDRPFSAKGTPISMRVKGRKLLSWQAEDGVAQPVPRSPVESAEPLETVTLIPYAAAKLRITAFPQLKS